MLDERLELGRRALGKFVRLDARKRGDMGLGLASAQEEVRIPFELIVIILVI